MTEFHAGDVVGGYRLEARVGSGGFGAVWRARHTGTGQLVAIKLLSTEANDAEQGRIAADIELLAATAAGQSPHVVRVIDGGVDPVPYAVMEFVSGTSLAEELRQRQRLSQAEVIEIGIAVAEALRVLDEAGIVHRDVKPSNVLIDRNGEVKLTDFGIAKIVGFESWKRRVFRRPSTWSKQRFSASPRGAPRSSSRTASPRFAMPTASWCWSTVE